MSTGVPSASPAPAEAAELGAAGENGAGAPNGRSGSAAGRTRWAPSPTLRWSEILWVILAGVALAVITSWPLVLHLPSRIAPDLGDPVRTAWEVAWVGHAMLHDPLHLFLGKLPVGGRDDRKQAPLQIGGGGIGQDDRRHVRLPAFHAATLDPGTADQHLADGEIRIEPNGPGQRGQ